MRIHYGAKGNAELLRRHGFVVPENPADVCPLTLDELMTEAEAEAGTGTGTGTGTETGTETETARVTTQNTFYLFRGMEAFGMLPEGLIRATIAKRRGVRVEDVRDAVEGGDEEAAAARAIARLARANAARVPVGTPPPIAAAVDPGVRERAGMARGSRGVGISPRAEGAARGIGEGGGSGGGGAEGTRDGKRARELNPRADSERIF